MSNVIANDLNKAALGYEEVGLFAAPKLDLSGSGQGLPNMTSKPYLNLI
jgi:hypothetical protein